MTRVGRSKTFCAKQGVATRGSKRPPKTGRPAGQAGRSRPGWSPRNSAQDLTTLDQNRDLLGYTFQAAGGAITVTGTAPWNEQYVLVDTPTGPSARVASQVRRRKELE